MPPLITKCKLEVLTIFMRLHFKLFALGILEVSLSTPDMYVSEIAIKGLL